MDANQKSDVEVFKAKVEEATEAWREAKALDHQREVLRPQLVKAAAALARKVGPLNQRLKEIETAIGVIEGGNVTTFRLRAPRKTKTPAKAVSDDSK